MNGGLEIISVAHAKEWKDFIESFEHTFNIMNYYCPLKLFDSTKN